jgi:3-oxoacyl-[acyl-carrier protein] reductase
MTSGGEDGFPQEVSYGAAKAALVNYTRSASLELGRYGVTANAVHPPITDTGWVTDDVRRSIEKDDRFFSVAEPREVADVVAFLVSDAGGRVTGNVLRMA